MSTNGGMAAGDEEVFDEGGAAEAPEAGSGEETAPSWLEGLDDETRSYVEGKGWKDVGSLIRSAREAEAGMHQSRQAAEAYERQLAQLAQQAPPQQGYGSEPQNPWAMVDQQSAAIAQAIDSGEIEPGQGLAYAMNLQREALMAEFEQRLQAQQQQLVEQNISPLFNQQWEGHHRSQAQRMRDELGEDYDKLKFEADKILRHQMEIDDNFRYNPEAIPLSFAEAFRRREMAARRSSQAQTLQNGARGPGGRSVDPAKAILDGIDAVAPAGMNGGLI